MSAVRAPGFGGLDADAEPREPVADPEVGRHPGVRVGERAHRDVLRRPRPDARQVEQPRARLGEVDAGPELEPVGERARHRRDRALPGAGHRQRRRHRDDRFRRRPGVRQRAVGLGQRLTGRRHQPRGERPRRRKRDLLAEHGADRQLAAVGGARHAQPRPRRHERAEHRVAGEMGVGGRAGGRGAEDRPRRRSRRGRRTRGGRAAARGRGGTRRRPPPRRPGPHAPRGTPRDRRGRATSDAGAPRRRRRPAAFSTSRSTANPHFSRTRREPGL